MADFDKTEGVRNGQAKPAVLTLNEIAAIDGAASPSAANPFATLADAGGGAPSAHHTSHENGGSDEIDVTGLAGAGAKLLLGSVAFNAANLVNPADNGAQVAGITIPAGSLFQLIPSAPLPNVWDAEGQLYLGVGPDVATVILQVGPFDPQSSISGGPSVRGAFKFIAADVAALVTAMSSLWAYTSVPLEVFVAFYPTTTGPAAGTISVLVPVIPA